jgi:hypothetical protein
MGPDYEPVPEEAQFICDLQPELCIGNNPGKTAKAHTQMFSVLRTGTGDLDLMAAGNLSMDSPGVYTAGTQSSNVDPLYNQKRGHLSDNNSVLGTAVPLMKNGSTVAATASIRPGIRNGWQSAHQCRWLGFR